MSSDLCCLIFFIFAMNQMTMSDVNGVTAGDKPTMKYHQTLQFPEALEGAF